VAERIDVGTEFGPFLIGRAIGAEIRKRYFSGEPNTWPRILDFSNVKQATESCLDELFGTLAREKGNGLVTEIAVVGASKAIRETYDFVRSVIESPPKPLTPEAIERLLSSTKKGGRKAS